MGLAGLAQYPWHLDPKLPVADGSFAAPRMRDSTDYAVTGLTVYGVAQVESLRCSSMALPGAHSTE